MGLLWDGSQGPHSEAMPPAAPAAGVGNSPQLPTQPSGGDWRTQRTGCHPHLSLAASAQQAKRLWRPQLLPLNRWHRAGRAEWPVAEDWPTDEWSWDSWRIWLWSAHYCLEFGNRSTPESQPRPRNVGQIGWSLLPLMSLERAWFFFIDAITSNEVLKNCLGIKPPQTTKLDES